MSVDIHSLARRLARIESIALLPTADSTNRLGRRVMTECLENELPFPSAVIVALEQTAGRGRGDRGWYAPAGKGIWATTLLTRSAAELPLLPLEAALAVVRFLRERCGVESRIKWPNDIHAGGAKIAGILIEARTRETDAFVIVGVGVNVLPLGTGSPPNSTSVTEQGGTGHDVAEAIEAFVEVCDRELFRPYDPVRILEEWRSLSVHRGGDRVAFQLGPERIDGLWDGIDDLGRARILAGGEVRLISAGDLIEFRA
ncbi:MAG TPA: biotin--[acetyl-CoA-carboxylase] ligase [Thermoanaerobaculia bacterium]|nr:biotin--[acetyl-CoA-carboxylase] ligase [Thermoanaerobaculia bacterium]